MLMTRLWQPSHQRCALCSVCSCLVGLCAPLEFTTLPVTQQVRGDEHTCCAHLMALESRMHNLVLTAPCVSQRALCCVVCVFTCSPVL